MTNASKKKVIILSEIEWSFLKQRHQLLAEYLYLQDYEVHFIQKVPSRIPNPGILFNFIKKFIKLNRNIYRNSGQPKSTFIRLHYSIFLPQTNNIFRFYNKYIASVYYARMARNGIVYTFSPSTYEMVHKRKRYNYKIVFDIVHNWWEMPWSNPTSRRAATQLLKEADEVICDSMPLSEHLSSKYQREKINIVLPGVNNNWVNKCEFLSIVENKPHHPASIVFFGNLRENSDIQLIKSLALSGSRIDAYGNVTPDVRSMLDGLVGFTGPLPQDELMTVVQRYDYTLLPYSNDSFSKWISPAKYFEVLALGKPILSRSNLSHMPGWNRLCHDIKINESIEKNDINEQLKAISEKHVKERNREYGQAIAKKHTWPSQLQKISQIISSCGK